MIYRAWRGQDKPVARLVFGTTRLVNSQSCHVLLDNIFGSGGTTFDTARVYGAGESEACLGAWMKSRQLHERVTVLTKGGHPCNDSTRLSFADLKQDIEASLAALRTDVLDVFLLHRDDPAVPVGQVMEALAELRRRGYLRAYGASNWAASRVAAAQRYAEASDLQGFCVSSPQFSLASWAQPPWPGCHSISGVRGSGEREWYRKSALPVLSWSSLAGGLFSDGPATAQAPSGLPATAQAYVTQKNLEILLRAREFARSKRTSVAAVALSYVLGESDATHAVVACSHEHFQENLRAFDLQLTREDHEWLGTQVEREVT